MPSPWAALLRPRPLLLLACLAVLLAGVPAARFDPTPRPGSPGNSSADPQRSPPAPRSDAPPIDSPGPLIHLTFLPEPVNLTEFQAAVGQRLGAKPPRTVILQVNPCLRLARTATLTVSFHNTSPHTAAPDRPTPPPMSAATPAPTPAPAQGTAHGPSSSTVVPRTMTPTLSPTLSPTASLDGTLTPSATPHCDQRVTMVFSNRTAEEVAAWAFSARELTTSFQHELGLNDGWQDSIGLAGVVFDPFVPTPLYTPVPTLNFTVDGIVLSSKEDSNKVAVVGIVVGVIAAVGLVVAGAVIAATYGPCGDKKKAIRTYKYSANV